MNNISIFFGNNANMSPKKTTKKVLTTAGSHVELQTWCAAQTLFESNSTLTPEILIHNVKK